MKSKKPKVSIIIPCYNSQKYISRCIKSILCQTFKQFEVIIIDDGSTDNTKKLIFELINKDKRFKYFYQQNFGQGYARNKGIEYAISDYICFVDSDDDINSKYLDTLYNAITSDDFSFATCNIKRIYKKNISYNVVNDFAVKTCRYPAPWKMIIKKSILEKYEIKFSVGHIYEDLQFTSEYFLVSNKYINTNKYIYNYYQNDNSTMHKIDDKIFDIYQVINNIEEFAKKKNVYDSNIETVEFICIYHVLIGTVFRASFHKDFGIKMLKSIIEFVEIKYPNWYKNQYVKKLPFSYKIYLYLLNKGYYYLLCFILKHFAKYLSL